MVLIGIIYDEYTPAVEAQLTRDIIALQNAHPRDEFEVQCVGDEPSMDRLLNAFNIVRVTGGKPALYVVYRTTEWWPEYPDERTATVICRDLYIEDAAPRMSGEPSVGYYVPTTQGRPIRPQNPLNRMGHKGNGKGMVDPAIKLIWG